MDERWNSRNGIFFLLFFMIFFKFKFEKNLKKRERKKSFHFFSFCWWENHVNEEKGKGFKPCPIFRRKKKIKIKIKIKKKKRKKERKFQRSPSLLPPSLHVA